MSLTATTFKHGLVFELGCICIVSDCAHFMHTCTQHQQTLYTKLTNEWLEAKQLLNESAQQKKKEVFPSFVHKVKTKFNFCYDDDAALSLV